MSDSGFIGETEGSSVRVSNREFTLAHNQFTVCYRSELSVRVVKSASVKRRFTCNVWGVRLLQFVRQDLLLGND
jgi:hypothetical protein